MPHRVSEAGDVLEWIDDFAMATVIEYIDVDAGITTDPLLPKFLLSLIDHWFCEIVGF